MKTSDGIWTPANVVTMVRVALVPVWLLCAELCVPSPTQVSVPCLAVAGLYILISLTDKLDGYLARSRNEVTAFGKFLDPIADKLAVVVALCFLLETGEVSSWVLLIIVSREFLVSGLRMVVASSGVVVAASNLGKWKTAVTMLAICGLLVLRAIPQGVAWATIAHTAFHVLLWIAVILTAWSGVDYFVHCWPYVSESNHE
ncbi:MAG: CDP-diacylglycerol--glycerol-3-phosphate 3-phosphatidyltransferase [Coriobacteriales bacterium]|nr:CDP-diacylglycerol--glycerol-3-phosphate 3-phosphatidyltransferase [Coriobacteriales bacterium]